LKFPAAAMVGRLGCAFGRHGPANWACIRIRHYCPEAK
jgi:hypothetical protein